MNLSKITGAVSELFQKAGKKNVTQAVKVTDSIAKGTSKEITKSLDCLANQAKAMSISKVAKCTDFAPHVPTSSHDFIVGANMLKAKGLNYYSTSINYLKELPTGEFDKLKAKAMDSVENGVENGIKSAKDSFGAINAAKENAYLDSQLANKSASLSASVIENDPKVQQNWLKEDLMQKHGEQFSAKKAQAQRKADLMAKYGNKLAK